MYARTHASHAYIIYCDVKIILNGLAHAIDWLKINGVAAYLTVWRHQTFHTHTYTHTNPNPNNARGCLINSKQLFAWWDRLIQFKFAGILRAWYHIFTTMQFSTSEFSILMILHNIFISFLFSDQYFVSFSFLFHSLFSFVLKQIDSDSSK